MLSFLHDLLENGRVIVPLAADPAADDSVELQQMILEVDADARLEMPHDAPAFILPAAIWALRIIENACRFLVYRELDAELIAPAMGTLCPGDPSAARTYSVDLFLRYLPDVTRMAKGIGPGDPLVEQLQKIAGQWPLSSVGMPGIICENSELDLIISHPALCQLYVDRIIERADTARLSAPAIGDAIRSALGAHRSLAPEISRAVEKVQE